MNELSPTKPEENAEESRKRRDGKRTFFKGEWLVVFLIFVIAGVAGFFYAQSELNRMDNGRADEQVETPTPETERTEL